MNRTAWLKGEKKTPYVVTDEKKRKIRQAIYTALGESSMCWSPRPNTQVFDSNEAKRIGEELVDFIEKEM